LRKVSATVRHCDRALAASGWANTVRMVAATMAMADLGARAKAFLKKCTRQRCQLDPCSTAPIAA